MVITPLLNLSFSSSHICFSLFCLQVCELAARASVSLDANASTDDSTASDPTVDVSTPGTTVSTPAAPAEQVSPEMLAKQVEDHIAILSHLRRAVQMYAEKNARLAQNVSFQVFTYPSVPLCSQASTDVIGLASSSFLAYDVFLPQLPFFLRLSNDDVTIESLCIYLLVVIHSLGLVSVFTCMVNSITLLSIGYYFLALCCRP